MRVDIQVALTVLGRIQPRPEFSPNETWVQVVDKEIVVPSTALNLARTDLRFAHLPRSDLQGVDFTDASLQHANLEQAQLNGAGLSRTDLRRANLRKAHFRYALMYQTNLRRADLYGADFRNAELHGACFDYCNLLAAQFYGGLDSLSFEAQSLPMLNSRAEQVALATEYFVGSWQQEPSSARRNFISTGATCETLSLMRLTFVAANLRSAIYEAPY